MWGKLSFATLEKYVLDTTIVFYHDWLILCDKKRLNEKKNKYINCQIIFLYENKKMCSAHTTADIP